jgi:hypothetical protein
MSYDPNRGRIVPPEDVLCFSCRLTLKLTLGTFHLKSWEDCGGCDDCGKSGMAPIPITELD